MTRPRLLAFLPLAALLAACAQSPQAAPGPAPAPSPSATPSTPAPAPAPAPIPAPASAAGQYDFTTMAQGQQVTGTITIVEENGRYTGSVASSAMAEIPLTSVTVEGQSITVTGDTPDGEAVIQLTLQGMDFTGTWSYGGQSGTLTGRKRG